MKKKIFAVCDLEEEYTLNFMDYLRQKKFIPFDVCAFTSVESLLRFGKDQDIELLLISERAMKEEVKELHIEKLIVLAEGDEFPELDQYAYVYKYQATADVLREVMTVYGQEPGHISFLMPSMKRNTRVIGVYSPIGRCGKTTFALTLGQMLAKKKKVLFLNLDFFSGYPQLAGKDLFHSLSNLFYYARIKDEKLLFRMNGMVESFNNLDYLPTVHSPQDITEASWEYLDKILTEIIAHSHYDILLIDVGNGYGDFAPLLSGCDQIYMPVQDDVISTRKIAQFEKMMNFWGYEEIIKKIERLHLPRIRNMEEKSLDPERLLFTALGNFVKEYV